MNKNFINWQLSNKNEIMHIYKLIVADLEKYELIITDKKKIYEEIVLYLYKTTVHVKYIK
tara:strand:- start:819 stop:998 length:180 start_codon:yes stop_codon:yes gene_type:complete